MGYTGKFLKYQQSGAVSGLGRRPGARRTGREHTNDGDSINQLFSTTTSASVAPVSAS
jgi:hypothetical protein